MTYRKFHILPCGDHYYIGCEPHVAYENTDSPKSGLFPTSEEVVSAKLQITSLWSKDISPDEALTHLAEYAHLLTEPLLCEMYAEEQAAYDEHCDEMMGGKVSPLQVLCSAAGFYLGHTYFDTELHAWLPWSRQSRYFNSEAQASHVLSLWLEEEAILLATMDDDDESYYAAMAEAEAI